MSAGKCSPHHCAAVASSPWAVFAPPALRIFHFLCRPRLDIVRQWRGPAGRYTDAVAELPGHTLRRRMLGPSIRITQSERIDSAIAFDPEHSHNPGPDARARRAPTVERPATAGFQPSAATPGSACCARPTALSRTTAGLPYRRWMARRLGGEGNIANRDPAQNGELDQRTLGMEHALRKYPGPKRRRAVGVCVQRAKSRRVRRSRTCCLRMGNIDAVWCA